jgi:hypothetical protein
LFDATSQLLCQEKFEELETYHEKIESFQDELSWGGFLGVLKSSSR